MLKSKIIKIINFFSEKFKVTSIFKVVNVDASSYIVSYQLIGKNIVIGSEPENLIKAGLESRGFNNIDQDIIINCFHYKVSNKHSFIKAVSFTDGKFVISIINEKSNQLLFTTPTEVLSNKSIKNTLTSDDIEKICYLKNMENNYVVNNSKQKASIARNIKVYYCKP